MTRVLRGVEARAIRELLDHPRHVDRRQTARLHLPVATDRPEQRPGANRGGFDPRLYRPHRARLGIRPVRNADLAVRGLLIGLRPPQRDGQAVLLKRAILDIERDQLRPAERAREPQQDQRPISRADQPQVRGVRHRTDVIGERGRLLRGRRPERASNTLHGVLDHAGRGEEAHRGSPGARTSSGEAQVTRAAVVRIVLHVPELIQRVGWGVAGHALIA